MCCEGYYNVLRRSSTSRSQKHGVRKMATTLSRFACLHMQKRLFRVVPRNLNVCNGYLRQRLVHMSHFMLNSSELKLTSSCIKQLKKILEEEQFLRVVIEGGGCAGFQYKFEVDKELQEDDKVFEEEGVKVVVDMDSLDLVKGSSIDYQVEMIKSSFVVLKNPNAEKGCSCGTSFSIKL